MEVLKRSQITEVTTIRKVSHVLNWFGVIYTRTQSVMLVMDFMGTDVQITNEKIKWGKYTSSNTIEYFTKKQVKDLKLEMEFQKMKFYNINEYNGNGINHYDLINNS